MNKPKVLILRTAGTNCDYESQEAFNLCGAKTERVHINVLLEKREEMLKYDILVFPGGFSYGDDIASGKILANEIKNKIGDILQKFALSGRPIIGICNGFQVLLKMGLLPDENKFEQVATLSYNDSDKFECRWIYLKTIKGANSEAKCLWTKNLPDIISLPIAHGEGKFIADGKVIEKLKSNGQVAFEYCLKNGGEPGYPFDPNGSMNHIAALCNDRGNVFGLMPHPERYVFSLQHPAREGFDGEFGWGKVIFQNAVDYVKA
jgi:phosphoribosylformylglycinamidine synthase